MIQIMVLTGLLVITQIKANDVQAVQQIGIVKEVIENCVFNNAVQLPFDTIVQVTPVILVAYWRAITDECSINHFSTKNWTSVC